MHANAMCISCFISKQEKLIRHFADEEKKSGNPYYFFLCKCELFVHRFGLVQYKSVFAKEERIKFIESGQKGKVQ